MTLSIYSLFNITFNTSWLRVLQGTPLPFTISERSIFYLSLLHTVGSCTRYSKCWPISSFLPFAIQPTQHTPVAIWMRNAHQKVAFLNTCSPDGDSVAMGKGVYKSPNKRISNIYWGTLTNNSKVESCLSLPFCLGSMEAAIRSLTTTQESERDSLLFLTRDHIHAQKPCPKTSPPKLLVEWIPATWFYIEFYEVQPCLRRYVSQGETFFECS